MSNFDNFPMPAQADAAKLQSSLEASGSAGGGVQYMEYKSHGNTWRTGRDGVTINGSAVLVHPGSFVHGLIGFNLANKPVKVIRPVTQPVPTEADMPVTQLKPDGDGNPGTWNEVYGFTAVILDGPAAGIQAEYVPSTYGGVQVCRELAAKVAGQLGVDIEHAFAMVSLETDSYTHSTRGNINTPVLELLGFCDSEGNGADGQPLLLEEAVVEVEPEPVAAVAEAPARRRRRSS